MFTCLELHSTKLRVEDMREAHQVIKEAQWISDKEATNCKGCSKEFSISRRRVFISYEFLEGGGVMVFFLKGAFDYDFLTWIGM